MTIFWWVAGVLLGIAAAATTIAFLLYVIRGDDEYLEFAKRARHWVVVVALASFNIGIFKHILWTLWEIWRS